MIREHIAQSGRLQVLHEGGYSWEAGFEWSDAALPKSLEWLVTQLEVPIPEPYLAFLRYSNGATLYRDILYGQWGYILYSAETLVAARNKWQETLGLPADYLVFGECIGDPELLLFRIDSNMPDEHGAVVVHAELALDLAEWRIVEGSFYDWLDHLIVAQGAKYWNWGV